MIIFSYALAEKNLFYKQNSLAATGLKKIITDKDKTIEEFTYKTSHDILGPVKTILGLTNLALSTKHDDNSIYLEKINQTALKLESIITAISEVNTIQSHEVNAVKIDFNYLIENSIKLPMLKKNLSFIQYRVKKVDANSVILDYYLVHTLLSNLLLYNLNCIQYSVQKNVSLVIEITKKQVRITCTNNGEEIPDNYHSKLFDLFYRISNQKSDLGTNLKLVKLSCDKLDGIITVKNTKGSSEFEITIPYS
jgi:K+-sensing histidine kinase KdpD